MAKNEVVEIQFVDDKGKPWPDLEVLSLPLNVWNTILADAALAEMTVDDYIAKLLKDYLETLEVPKKKKPSKKPAKKPVKKPVKKPAKKNAYKKRIRTA